MLAKPGIQQALIDQTKNYGEAAFRSIMGILREIVEVVDERTE
jgi:hypothetical protein